jgi:2-dehydropantoate 2-reductase
MQDSCASLWAAFLASGTPVAESAAGASYSSWQFGLGSEMADGLLGLVLSGGKRSTAGALWSYELEGEPVPVAGDYSVVIDGAGVGRCVLRTTDVQVVPFDQVGEEHARLEGEGDLSLEYWRESHWAYYTRELASFGRAPEPDMPVVCERFEVVFRPSDAPLASSIAAGSDIDRHVCVFGVGGVGGYFGGRLACWLASQAAPAWHVHFVARGEHLAAIKSRGLELNTPAAQLICVPASASADMSDVPTPDVVLLCVKSYGLDEALRQIAEHIHDDTVVIPLLNGVDVHERIRAHLPRTCVLPACVFVGTHVDRPGAISQAGGDGVIFLGGDPDHPGFVPTAFLRLLEDAGIRFTWFDDPRPAIWEKYVFISAFGLVTAASRKTLGEVLEDAALLKDVHSVMGEVVGLAAREGVALGPDAIPNAIAKAGGFPPDTKTSLQRDVEAGGPNEGDLFGGTILRLGERHGVPTPATERVYSQIR